MGDGIQDNTIKARSKAKFTPLYVNKSNTYNVIIDYEFIELLKADPTVNHETMDYNYDSESSEVEES